MAFPAACAKPLALGHGPHYFGPVFNGSGSLVVTGRDKDATWRKPGALCRELDWSRPRLIHELQNGLRYRTFPPAINWDDPAVRRALDVEASTLPLGYATVSGLANSWTIQEAIGIEVLPPGVPADAARAATLGGRTAPPQGNRRRSSPCRIAYWRSGRAGRALRLIETSFVSWWKAD